MNKPDIISKLDEKIKQLEARKQAELAKITQKERKRKQAILLTYGEYIENALIAGKLPPEKLKADLLELMPEGARRTNAINAIEEILKQKIDIKKATKPDKKSTKQEAENKK
jgi:hypothetical protein